MSQSHPQRFELLEIHANRDNEAFGDAVRRGLGGERKELACRFFYDAEGSRIFEEICELPEYYLTRAEREILDDRAEEIAAHFDGRITLAELGSGSSTKTRVLIEALLERHGRLRYVPVDISRSILEISSHELLAKYEGLEIRAIASEYGEGLRHLEAESHRPKLVAWLGSNVGNFERPAAAAFLAEVVSTLAPADRLLMGVDLRKDPEVLQRAYDDRRGVTARFNLNVLGRINRDLGGEFDLGTFRHRAVYREDLGRMEMHLVSQREQRVRIDALDLEVEFGAGETIHTENSHKYAPEEIDALAAGAGLRTAERWLDSRGYFSLNLLAPA